MNDSQIIAVIFNSFQARSKRIFTQTDSCYSKELQLILGKADIEDGIIFSFFFIINFI